LQYWHQINVALRLALDGLLNHLNIPAGDLSGRLHIWGSRDFDNDYQDPGYVSILDMLRFCLLKDGVLTVEGLVTPNTTPTNSPKRGGGGGLAAVEMPAKPLSRTSFRSMGVGLSSRLHGDEATGW
jgi:hypothetical protein